MSQAPPPLLRMETYQDDQLPSFSKDDLSPSSLRLRSGPSTPSSETQLSVRHHDHQDQTDPVEGPRRRTGRRRQLFRKVRRHVRRRLGGKESALLILYSLGFLVSSCGNSIFFKKMTSAMPNYAWFITQIPCLAYVPIFGVVVMAASSRGDITEEMRHFPQYKFGIMGALDGLTVLMCVVGGAFTSGPAQLVLGQAVMPVTLALATAFLGQRFHILQYLGAAVIIAGVMVSNLGMLFPQLLPAHHAVHNVPIFNIIYASSALPSAISQIYKEVAFNDRELNVNYMQYCVAIYQVAIGLLTAPLNALPFLGPQRIPLDGMSSMVTNGSACLFLARNSIVENCGGPHQPLCDDCEGSWIPVFLYLIFNVFYNSFALLIVKHGGAALSFVIATLRLPLTTVCFYSAAIVGTDATSPSLQDFLGLVVLVLGAGIYRYGAAVRLEEGHSEEYPIATEDSTALDIGIKDEESLLPITEEDSMSDVEEVAAIASLMIEHGPYILRIHHHRTQPLYLAPVKLDDVGYTPPKMATTQEIRPPRRRTMHDFRDAQIDKIRRRRLPSRSPQMVSEDMRRRPSSNGSLFSVDCDTDDYDDGHLSDGSVNSLAAASRPHPLEYRNPRMSKRFFGDDIRTLGQDSKLEVLMPTPTRRPASNDDPSFLRSHLSPLPHSPRLPLSVMLEGGLDLAVSRRSSPSPTNSEKRAT